MAGQESRAIYQERTGPRVEEPKRIEELAEWDLIQIRLTLIGAPMPPAGVILGVDRAEQWLARYRAWHVRASQTLDRLYK